MEELNLTELLRYYLKRLPIIILVTLLVLIIGYVYVEQVQVPMYHGTTTIILVQKTEDNQNANVTQNELNINEKLVSTYSNIIKSRRVVEPVIDSLKLSDSYKSLQARISVTSVSETPIIKVTVSDEDKDQAVLIANELARIFEREISQIYNLENISVIDKAIVEENPYNVNLVKQMIISGVIGLVLSCGIIFVMYYFDNTINNKKEIENKLKIAVLGEIPVANKLDAMEKRKKKNKRVENNVNNDLDFDHIDDDLEEEVKKLEDKAKEEKKTSSSKKSTTTKKTTTKKTVKKEEGGNK